MLQNSRYGSSKVSYGERYNHERMRDSPNGHSYRSDSPDSASPRERDRDRSYQSKAAYLQQKIRDKERENRDYKAREKYSGKKRFALNSPSYTQTSHALSGLILTSREYKEASHWTKTFLVVAIRPAKWPKRRAN